MVFVIKMNISVVGPTYPYRGGISHYNTQLCKSLNRKHKINCISFKNLYSKFLIKLFYKADIDFKDKTSKEKIQFPAKEIIDTINPFTWLSAFWEIRKNNPELLIFHWQSPYFSLVYFTIMFLARIFTRAKILLICHNVLPHESRFADKLLTRLTFSQADYFIVHSKEDFNNLKRSIPNKPTKLGFHPTYTLFNLTNSTKEQAKKELNLTGKVLLFFGFIRKYKGLDYLLKALPLVLKKIKVTLLIVGEFWESKKEYLAEIKKFGPAIRLVDKYVPNEEVEKYFSASDVLVLPYVSATQSGIVQIAYGFNKPVLVSDVGGLPDVVFHNKTGLIFKSKNIKEIAESIISFYEKNKENEFIENIKKEKSRFSWENYIKIIESFKK